VRAEFIAAAGLYEGRWFDPKFKKNEFDPEARDSRLWSEAEAKSIVAACRDKPGTVTEESKPSTQQSPALFDLTTLQREANSRFGFSAKNTLGLAQALYEKHKVLTYPRTDARALPEDYLDTVKQTMDMLADSSPNYLPHAKKILSSGWVKPNKRIFDNSKISDHFAIIPTLQAPKNLSEPEQKLYDLVVRRFLAVFFPAAEFQVTTRITEVAGHHFKTEGKVLVNPGWLVIYGREAQGKDDKDANLVPVQKDEKVKTDKVESVGLTTRRRPATTKRRCCRPWKAPASSTTTSCARRWPARAWARRPRARPSSKACWREVSGARRPRADSHRQGVPADDAAARAGRGGTDPGRADRRVGTQAVADRARTSQA
jgi:DNA topoisomerase-3